MEKEIPLAIKFSRRVFSKFCTNRYDFPGDRYLQNCLIVGCFRLDFNIPLSQPLCRKKRSITVLEKAQTSLSGTKDLFARISLAAGCLRRTDIEDRSTEKCSENGHKILKTLRPFFGFYMQEEEQAVRSWILNVSEVKKVLRRKSGFGWLKRTKMQRFVTRTAAFLI